MKMLVYHDFRFAGTWLAAGILSAFFLFLLTAAIFGALSASPEPSKEDERKRNVPDGIFRQKDEEGIKAGEGKSPGYAWKGFLIREIFIENGDLLGRGLAEALTAPFIDRELGRDDIQLLCVRVTKALIEEGLITSRVGLPLEQKLSAGKLRLRIVPGIIEKIYSREPVFRNRTRLFSAFPFFEGKLLNINDLEYGIETMNRLESNNAMMRIAPGESEGTSEVVIDNERGWPLHVEAGFDNLGQKGTGECRRKMTAVADDIAGFNDYSIFSCTESMGINRNRAFSRTRSLSFSVPLGFWSFSASGNMSEYRQFFSGMNRRYEMEGREVASLVMLERLVWKRGISRIRTGLSLNLKKKESYIEDQKIDTQSGRLSLVRAQADYSGYLCGGFLTAGADYRRGMKILGAGRESSDLPGDMPSACFNICGADLGWNRFFSLFGRNIGYFLYLSGQYSGETLHSSEKMTLGDLHTVRGFREFSASGDMGCFMRNEISIHDLSRMWTFLSGTRFFVGFDWGRVRESAGREANGGRGEAALAGISAGIGMGGDVFNLNITWARKILAPSCARENDQVLYFSSGFNITGALEGAFRSGLGGGE
jgi:hemolysin activation/secretion protein